MPPVRRRRFGHALGAGLGAGLQSYGQSMLTTANRNQTIGAQSQLDQANYVETVMAKVMDGTWSPEQASAALAARGVKGAPDPRAMQPSLASREGAISKEIAGADSLAKLPTEQRIRRRMDETGISQDQPDQMIEGPSSVMGFPLVMSTKPSDAATSLLDELSAQHANLQNQVDYTPVEDIGTNGVARRRYTQKNKLGELGDLQTERTPEQEGMRAGQIEETQTPYDVTHATALEEGTRGAKQTSAVSLENALAGPRARSAGMAEGSRIQAQGTPEALQILGDRAAVEAEAKPPTQDEVKNYDFAGRAAAAHQRMLALEPKLATRGLFINFVGLNNPDAIKDPVSRQYAAAMRELINANLRRESGAAIGKDEYENATKQFTFNAGDDPKSLKYKQDARRRALSGMVKESGNKLGGQFVQMSDLQALAKLHGTTVEQELSEANKRRLKVIY